MLAFYVNVEATDFFNAADTLHVEENFIFKFLPILGVDVESLLGFLRVVQIFVDLEIVVCLLE